MHIPRPTVGALKAGVILEPFEFGSHLLLLGTKLKYEKERPTTFFLELQVPETADQKLL